MLNLEDWPTFGCLYKAICKGGLKDLQPQCGIAFFFAPKMLVRLKSGVPV